MTITAEDFARTAVALAASSSTNRADVCWRTLPILKTRALLGYRLDREEHERWRRLGLGGVVDAGQLELMLGLPVGLPVPVTSLTNLERVRLRKASTAAVSVVDGYAVRQAVAPVVAEQAVVPTRSWRSGLAVATRFAPFCARAVLLRKLPADVDELMERAAFYGVGVIRAAGDDLQTFVQPRAFRRMRFTAAGWQFAEDIYQHVR